MKHFLALGLAAAFFLVFSLHSKLHSVDHSNHACHMCEMGQAQHTAPASSGFNVVLTLAYQMQMPEAPGVSLAPAFSSFPRAPPNL